MIPMSTIPIQTLTIRFDDIPLRSDDIRLFRGEVMVRLPDDDRLHNHEPDGQSKYRYPLVQYRIWQNRATIFGIGEGVQAVRNLLDTLDQTPYQATPTLTDVGLTEAPIRYRLSQWWPMNTENLQKWEQTSGLVARIQLLERILTNQLLALCKDLGYWVPNRGLLVEIQELTETTPRQFHTQNATEPVHARLFEVVYAANLRLPDGIGVGKGVSKGFGVQRPVGLEQQSKRPGHSSRPKRRNQTQKADTADET